EEASGEESIVAGENYIADEGQVHAGADSGTVDGSYRGDAACMQSCKSRINRTQSVLGTVVLGRSSDQVAKVGAGTECLAGSGDHDRADVLICFCFIECRDELLDHRGGQRVTSALIRQRDDGRLPVNLSADESERGFCF